MESLGTGPVHQVGCLQSTEAERLPYGFDERRHEVSVVLTFHRLVEDELRLD